MNIEPTPPPTPPPPSPEIFTPESSRKRKHARENDYPEFDEYTTMNKKTKLT